MLYVCATPIGNLGDVTSRVLDMLRRADLIAAEDTRRTRKLLSHFDIHTPLTSFYAHNEAQKTAYVLERLRAGAEVALVTDAGLPGISDPGTRLVAAALAEGLPLSSCPGRRRRRRRWWQAACPTTQAFDSSATFPVVPGICGQPSAAGGAAAAWSWPSRRRSAWPAVLVSSRSLCRTHWPPCVASSPRCTKRWRAARGGAGRALRTGRRGPR